MAPKSLLNAWASGGQAVHKWGHPEAVDSSGKSSKKMRLQPLADQIVQRMLLKIGPKNALQQDLKKRQRLVL